MINKKKMTELFQCLIVEMAKTVKSYQSDFILDINAMNTLNEDGLFVGKYYCVFRENGCEFGDRESSRIDYFFNHKETGLKIFEIDCDKFAKVEMRNKHYNDLLNGLNGKETICIKLVKDN